MNKYVQINTREKYEGSPLVVRGLIRAILLGTIVPSTIVL